MSLTLASAYAKGFGGRAFVMKHQVMLPGMKQRIDRPR
jgi:hypothetical protein